jgi:DNA processing protein
VAVLGSGVDLASPRRHAALRERITTRGCVLSEYWPGTPPAPWRFPARNRIIAGVADAVVVVEAGERSGALITADFAVECGRPVLAAPGPPGAAASVGSNALLRAGAGMCEGADDVVAELPHLDWHAADGADSAPPPGGLDGEVYRLLQTEPLALEEIADRLAPTPPAAVAAALGRLEIDRRVLRGGHDRYWAAPTAA